MKEFFRACLIVLVAGFLLLKVGKWWERVTWRWGMPDDKLHAIDSYNERYFQGAGEWKEKALWHKDRQVIDNVLAVTHHYQVKFVEIDDEWIASDFSTMRIEPDENKSPLISREIRILRGKEWINLVEEE